MDKKNKEFAVIYFESEDLYSEVPVSWLTEDKRKCWWPKTLNARAYMNRGDKPQDNWELHNVRVDAYCSNLKSARLKAENPEYTSSSSEINMGRGLRKKNKTYLTTEGFSSSDSETITPPPSPTTKSTLNDVIVLEIPPDGLNFGQADFNGQTKGQEAYLSGNSCVLQEGKHSGIQYEVQEGRVRTPGVAPGLQPILEKEKHSGTQYEVQEYSERTQGLAPVLQPILEKDEPTGSCQCDTTILKEIYIKVTKLEKLTDDISKSLSSITINNNRIQFDNERMDLIGCLPLKTKEEIFQFDQKINEESMRNTYANFIRGIGGKDVKDFVNRALSSLFTNELGKVCSLVGQRGNFRLDGFNFIKILHEIILVAKGTCSYDIEKAISEWFRLSNQRLNRKNTGQQQANK